MEKTTVVTVRVKKEVKEALEEAGVNISKSIREYLEELVWKLQLEKEIENLRRILENIKVSERGFAEKSVREDRESH